MADCGNHPPQSTTQWCAMCELDAALEEIASQDVELARLRNALLGRDETANIVVSKLLLETYGDEDEDRLGFAGDVLRAAAKALGIEEG